MSFTVRQIREKPKRKPGRWKAWLITSLQLGAPALRLFQIWKREHDVKKEHERRVQLLKRVFLVLIALLCAALLLAGTVRALVAMQVLSIGDIANVTGTPPLTDDNGFTNVLLLGQGDDSHDGVDLTDTLIVASLDPKGTKSAVLLSIPRDLYILRTENMGSGRINSLYRDYKARLIAREGMTEDEASQAAMKELQKEISKMTNLDIQYSLKVDFIGFVEAVDAIGGVDVVVPEDLVDTQYPNNSYGYETFIIRAGPQHLDGATALKYARSRHSSSDFARSARQQQIIAALAEKAKNEGLIRDPKQIVSLFRILSENVETTMSMRELIGLADLGQQLDRSRLITMQLNAGNGLYGAVSEAGGLLYYPPREEFGGASVLLPVSIPPTPITYDQIQTLATLLTQYREFYLAEPVVSVLNAGAPSGSASRLAGELIRYGVNVDEVANASTDDVAVSQISHLTVEDEPLVSLFTEVLGVQSAPLPLDIPEEESRRLTILLGEDYSYEPLKDLVPPPSDDAA